MDKIKKFLQELKNVASDHPILYSLIVLISGIFLGWLLHINEVLSIPTTLIVSVLSISFGMYLQLKLDKHKERQRFYLQITKTFKGFLENSDPNKRDELREEFIDILYSLHIIVKDDKVIKCGQEFLDSVSIQADFCEESALKLLKNFLNAMRHDTSSFLSIFSKTRKIDIDFKLYSSNKKNQ